MITTGRNEGVWILVMQNNVNDINSSQPFTCTVFLNLKLSIYVILSLKKHSLLHIWAETPDNQLLRCEGFAFSSLHTASQAFTPALALRHVRWSVWRVESENLHTVSWWKPQENGLPVNVWMLFSGIIYVYRCAREALMCRATASYSSICFRKYSSKVFLWFVLGTFSDVKWYSCFPRFLVM